jgi:hypothetical protein
VLVFVDRNGGMSTLPLGADRAEKFYHAMARTNWPYSLPLESLAIYASDSANHSKLAKLACHGVPTITPAQETIEQARAAGFDYAVAIALAERGFGAWHCACRVGRQGGGSSIRGGGSQADWPDQEIRHGIAENGRGVRPAAARPTATGCVSRDVGSSGRAKLTCPLSQQRSRVLGRLWGLACEDSLDQF